MTDAPTFPLSMTHPGFRPATLDTWLDDAGNRVNVLPRGHTGKLIAAGTSIKFPPVTVHDQKQFDYHRSQGYVEGMMNPAAFTPTTLAEPDDGVDHQFPKWVRNAARTKEALVDDAAEEVAALERFAREEVEEARHAKVAADTALAATREPHDDVRAEVAELRQGLGRLEEMMTLLLEQRTAPAAPTGAGKGRSGERGA